MAMFREHISFGAAVAALGATLAYSYAVLTDPYLLFVLFGVTTLMSFMPDLDSDSGLPFHLVFGAFTLAVTALVLYFTLEQSPEDWRILLGVPLAAMAATWFILGGIFKRCTHHRGMFHSIPANAIVFLGALLAARGFAVGDAAALVLAAGAGAGYLSHLILDELYAGISLDGSRFLPKKSLGGALKFFSSSKGANLCTYTLLAALIYAVLTTGAV